MPQITHVPDTDENGVSYMRQIVTPDDLRAILNADGDDHEPPIDFGPLDEWDVALDE